MRDDRDLAREPGPQPDPMLRPGRARPIMIWTIAFACVAIVVLVLIAIAPPLTNTAGVVNGRSPASRHDAANRDAGQPRQQQCGDDTAGGASAHRRARHHDRYRRSRPLGVRS